MSNPRQKNAPERSGVKGTELTSRVNQQRKTLKWSAYDFAGPRRELQKKGSTLRDISGKTQRNTSLRVPQYVGHHGINTFEGTGLGIYWIATRVQELEAIGWMIDSQREGVFGADGLPTVFIAQYLLLCFLMTRIDPQGSLDLGVA